MVEVCPILWSWILVKALRLNLYQLIIWLKSGHFGESTQPLGLLCLWNCSFVMLVQSDNLFPPEKLWAWQSQCCRRRWFRRWVPPTFQDRSKHWGRRCTHLYHVQLIVLQSKSSWEQLSGSSTCYLTRARCCPFLRWYLHLHPPLHPHQISINILPSWLQKLPKAQQTQELIASC